MKEQVIAWLYIQLEKCRLNVPAKMGGIGRKRVLDIAWKKMDDDEDAEECL